MDTWMRALLIFAQFETQLLAFTIGYLSVYQTIFMRAFVLMLLSMTVNALLKAFFQVPLAEHLGKEGYAFPSGHMQTMVVFWGFLLLSTKRPAAYIILLMMIVAEGIGMHHFGYHSLADMSAAVGFALLSIFIWQTLSDRLEDKQLFSLAALLASLCLLALSLDFV